MFQLVQQTKLHSYILNLLNPLFIDFLLEIWSSLGFFVRDPLSRTMQVHGESTCGLVCTHFLLFFSTNPHPVVSCELIF